MFYLAIFHWVLSSTLFSMASNSSWETRNSKMRALKTTRSISVEIRPFGMSQCLTLPPNYHEKIAQSYDQLYRSDLSRSESMIRKTSLTCSDRKISSFICKVAVGRKPSNVSQKRLQRRSSEVRTCLFVMFLSEEICESMEI